MTDKNTIEENLKRRVSIKEESRKSSDHEADIDDSDEDGMTGVDTHSADYSRIGLVEKEIDLPIKPKTEEIITAPKPKTEEIITAPDEFKKNQDPQVDSEDINLGGSNPSANTTSTSAL